MSIEDVEDFCEVCEGVVHSNRRSYNAHKSDCKCKRIKVKLVREVMHRGGESRFYAKWLELREKPQKGEFLNIDGDCYSVDMVEHVADSICALTVWLRADDENYSLTLGRHNINVPPQGMLDVDFEKICKEYDDAKWWRTDIWWRKK